ncbi:MAG: HIT family protein [Nanobdellota archaeon]
MDNCIFCKIVKGEIPCHKIYEDDDIFCFLDIYPTTDGHFLVVTKSHYEVLDDVPNELLAKSFQKAKEIVGEMKEKYDFKGYNLLQNNYPVAQQEIPHFHINIIPRYEKDDAKIDVKKSSNLMEVKESAKKI